MNNENNKKLNNDTNDTYVDFFSVDDLDIQPHGRDDTEKFENDVLKAVNGVLNNDFGGAYYRNGYVSLADVFDLMCNKRADFDGNKNSFVHHLQMAFDEAFKYHVYYYNRYKNIDITIPKVSYDPDEVSFIITYKDCEEKHAVMEKIRFTKVNGRLTILNSPSPFIKDVLPRIEHVFSNFFDTFQKFKLWRESYDYNAETSIPNFFVKFQNYDILLYCQSAYPKDISSPFFRLGGHCHRNKLDCYSSSKEILNLVTNNANELFGKVFVKISDCPVWCQDELRVVNAKKVEEADEKDKKGSWIWPFKKR